METPFTLNYLSPKNFEKKYAPKTLERMEWFRDRPIKRGAIRLLKKKNRIPGSTSFTEDHIYYTLILIRNTFIHFETFICFEMNKIALK